MTIDNIDSWNAEVVSVRLIAALNGADCTYIEAIAYLVLLEREEPYALFSQEDFNQYMQAKHWYARFKFKTEPPAPFPSLDTVLAQLTPIYTFPALLHAWQFAFTNWARDEGYDIYNPELAPDKRRKQVDSAKLSRLQEIERIRTALNLAKATRDEAERMYSQLTRDAQQAMMNIVNERNAQMPIHQDAVRRLKEEYRTAKQNL